MKKSLQKMVGVAVFTVSILLITGCTTFKAEGLSFALVAENEVVLGSFSESVTVHKILGASGGATLFNITSGTTSDKIKSVIIDQINEYGGSGAKNITITYSANVLHYLGNWITGSIWAPAKLKITGDVVNTQSSAIATNLDEQIDAALKNINF